jgi:hypothetical protein
MSKELFHKLQPFVSTFSEAIGSKHNHGDTITVGGVVTLIQDINELLPIGDDEGVYMELDDGIGINKLIVPTGAYQDFKKANDLKIGSIVLAEGRLFVVNTAHTYELGGQTIVTDNHGDKTIRLLAWELKSLPDKVEYLEEQ